MDLMLAEVGNLYMLICVGMSLTIESQRTYHYHQEAHLAHSTLDMRWGYPQKSRIKSILLRLQLKSINGNLVSVLNMVIFMSVIRIMKRTS